jgi:MYXO-CTERM domain-containing protein
VTLDGSGSADANGDTLTYSWSQVSGPTVTLTGGTSNHPTFTPTQAETYVFELTVSDGVNTSAADEVTVLAYDPQTNNPPVANAGTDQRAKVGDTVTLDGSKSSDPDADTLTYSWVEVSGPSTVALSNATAIKPTFVPDKSGVYVFALYVNDGELTSQPDEVSIEVATSGGNLPPLANAGTDQVVVVNQWVTLDGTGSSDPESDTLTYAWSQVSGESVDLTDADKATAKFYGLHTGTYVFALVVNDGHSDSAPDNVQVVINSAGNHAPVANAGPDQSVNSGATVTLDGSASSDTDGDTLTYQWTQTAGPSAILSSNTVVKPTTVINGAGIVKFELKVNDGKVWSLADEVKITVNPAGNHIPVANAGADMQAKVGDTVTLDGSASSDADGDTLTYSWRQVSGAMVTMSAQNVAKPTFVASAQGTFVFGLIVNDSKIDSEEDTVTVTVGGANQAPVAVVQSPLTAYVNDTVTLDGSASHDPNGDTLTYTWSQTSGDPMTLTDDKKNVATFVAEKAGDFEFKLTVSDGKLKGEASVLVTVSERAADSGCGCAVEGNTSFGRSLLGPLGLLGLALLATRINRKRRSS